MVKLEKLSQARKFLAERLSRRADSEHEQAAIRLVVAVLLPVYTLLLPWFHGPSVELPELVILMVFVILSLLVLIHIVAFPEQMPVRRVVGTVVDMSAITYFFFSAPALAIPLYGLYLWVVVGNGFRYGRVFLWIALGLALVGFGSALLVLPYWRNNSFVGWGLWASMLAVCAYVGQLVDRLHKALHYAEAANRAKRRFISSISHELRTPLNAIIGMADLLQTTSLARDQKEMLQTLHDASRVMLALVEDVLDFSKIEAGKLTLERIRFVLPDLCRNTLEIFRYQAAAKGIRLEAVLDLDGADWVLGDEHHLRQVLVNLLSNAIKFTEQGHVELRANCVCDGTEKVRVRVEVRDTGIGMSEEAITRIFESFAQADESTTRRYGGTGLGTTIAKHLVESMGGEIGVFSRLGAGSTFWFEVPLDRDLRQAMSVRESQVSNATWKPQSMLPARSMHVLVAEDNPTNQRVIEQILHRAGHCCTIASDGEKALDLLLHGDFDAVLMDMNMPHLNGLDVAKAYRFMTSSENQVPIAMFTADATVDAKQDCQRAGIDEFLSKPIEVQSLLATLQRMVEPCQGHARSTKPGKMHEGGSGSRAPAFPPRTSGEVVEILDRNVLADLESLSDKPEFLDALLAGYMLDNEKLLNELQLHLDGGHIDEVRRILHAMKGAAVSVGAVSLRATCDRVEQLPGEKMYLKREELTSLLRDSFARACSLLNAYRRQRRSRDARLPENGIHRSGAGRSE